ncbi:MAG: DUF4214 domain-containing protein [Pseudomonadota bacterium]
MIYERWNAATAQDLAAIAAENWRTLDSGAYQFSTTITYEFANSVPSGLLYLVPQGFAADYRPLQNELQDFFRFQAAYVSNITNLTLTEVPSVRDADFADIVIGQHVMTAAGYAEYPWLGSQLLMLDTFQRYTEFGAFSSELMVHELGHALGLDHPFVGEPGEPNYQSNVPDDLQANAFTTLAYSGVYLDLRGNDDIVGFATFSPIDVYALQILYGTGTNTEDHTYHFLSNPELMPRWEGTTMTSPLDAPFTLVDVGGTDWVDLSGYTPGYATGDMVFDFSLGLTVATDGQLSTSEWDATLREFSDWTPRDSVRMLTIQPGTLIEKLTATHRSDTVIMADGDQEVIGLSGNDTVVFGSQSTQITVSLSADGSMTVLDRDGQGGTDRLANDVEVLRFADRSLDTNDFSGLLNLSADDFISLTEVYVAYFNRAADAEGLYFWADALAEGTDLEGIAELFFEQVETRALYTDPNDTNAFVTAVYDNVLGRTPDQSGFEFWQGVLARGEVSQGRFVLEVIKGAKAGDNSSDVDYLATKANLGLRYAAIEGLSDVADARNVMERFGDQQTFDTISALAAIDGHAIDAANATNSGLLMPLIGVVDDPFPFF